MGDAFVVGAPLLLPRVHGILIWCAPCPGWGLRSAARTCQQPTASSTPSRSGAVEHRVKPFQHTLDVDRGVRRPYRWEPFHVYQGGRILCPAQFDCTYNLMAWNCIRRGTRACRHSRVRSRTGERHTRDILSSFVDFQQDDNDVINGAELKPAEICPPQQDWAIAYWAAFPTLLPDCQPALHSSPLRYNNVTGCESFLRALNTTGIEQHLETRNARGLEGSTAHTCTLWEASWQRRRLFDAPFNVPNGP